MAMGESARTPSMQRREEEKPEQPVVATSREGGGKTGIVFGSLLVLLLLAGAFHYFAGDRSGTDAASAPDVNQSSDDAPGTIQPLADRAEKPAASVAPPASTSTQQPAPAPAQAEVLPATMVQTAASNTPPKSDGSAAPAASQSAASNSPPVVAPQPMRDQPAALPAQTAAAPKTEIVLVVKLGPAKIRAEPSKRSRAIGSVAKDTQLKELGRSGTWVEVETESGRGWIGGRLLAPVAAESR